MNQNPIDLVGLLIALLAFAFSKDVAAIVGPYAAIVILASAGAALSLSGHEEHFAPFRAFIYVLIRILVAVTLTVALAELLQHFVPSFAPRFTLVPLAFGIGWIRDYDAVRQWCAGIIARVVGRKVDGD